MLWASRIVDRFEHMGLLTQTFNDSFGELFRSNFLLTYALNIDVICVYTIFERAKPGIMHYSNNICLVYMYQHHDCSKRQAGWINDVLSCGTGSRAMNSLEH